MSESEDENITKTEKKEEEKCIITPGRSSVRKIRESGEKLRGSIRNYVIPPPPVKVKEDTNFNFNRTITGPLEQPRRKRVLHHKNYTRAQTSHLKNSKPDDNLSFSTKNNENLSNSSRINDNNTVTNNTNINEESQQIHSLKQSRSNIDIPNRSNIDITSASPIRSTNIHYTPKSSPQQAFIATIPRTHSSPVERKRAVGINRNNAFHTPPPLSVSEPLAKPVWVAGANRPPKRHQTIPAPSNEPLLISPSSIFAELEYKLYLSELPMLPVLPELPPCPPLNIEKNVLDISSLNTPPRRGSSDSDDYLFISNTRKPSSQDSDLEQLSGDSGRSSTDTNNTVFYSIGTFDPSIHTLPKEYVCNEEDSE